MTMHLATQGILRYFEFSHLPDALKDVSRPFHELAYDLVDRIPNGGAELTAALRKLLEAKDCAVRAYAFSPENN